MSSILVEDIQVGERRREDLGDLAALAESLNRYGLLHPVVIDAGSRLVAGGRRLAAARLLGWEQIDVRVLGELTEAELREIELEENLRRKDLTEYEASREMVRKARDVAPAIASIRRNEKRPSGKAPMHEASRQDLAHALGTNEPALRRAEQHVAAVERYPELEPLAQHPAIETAKALDRLPEPQRLEVREVITALPPDDRRRQIRDRAKAEAETGASILAFVGDPDGNIARAGLVISFNKAERVTRDRLLSLDVEALAATFDAEHWTTAGWFIRDVRAWLDALEQAQVSGPRLVEAGSNGK